MNTVLIEVRPLESSFEQMRRSVREGIQETQARISFATFDLLHKTCTPRRMRLLSAMTGAQPMGVRELARRVGRDVRAVHADAQALVAAGLVDKLEGGKLHFPYDAVEVGFTLPAAA